MTTLVPSLHFRCFSLFLPHFSTLAQEKRSENCLRFGTGGPSLCLYPVVAKYNISPRAKNGRSRKKSEATDLLTPSLASVGTIGILSTLTYTDRI